jgi:hypothetical protein
VRGRVNEVDVGFFYVRDAEQLFLVEGVVGHVEAQQAMDAEGRHQDTEQDEGRESERQSGAETKILENGLFQWWAAPHGPWICFSANGRTN